MTNLVLALFCALAYLAPSVVQAADTEPSVAENMSAMNTDHDHQVSVSEIRVYLQKKYGQDYQKDLLALMEKRADAKSCGSSFTRPLE